MKNLIKYLYKNVRKEIKHLKKMFKKEIKFLKKCWRKWEKICELHNEDITYANYEEYTHPTDIYIPALISFMISFIGLYVGIKGMIIGFVICCSILYPLFFLPMLLEVSKKKEFKKIFS